MLGERIRKLRKQKKMTLEALAGKQLTKGMLSLIENNKANPSMESLVYIAEQLEVEVTDLLEEMNAQELRGILEKVEKIYYTDTDKLKGKYKQLIDIIEPHVEKLSQGYESARLLEIYSYSLYYEKKQHWQVPSNRAAKLYEQMNITANRASIGIFRAVAKFIEHDYSSALEIFLYERSIIESIHAYIDPMTQLNLYYHEAILYFAVGDENSAIRAMERAIIFSNERKIFYRIDDLYRLAAANAMFSNNKEKKEYYLEKLKQYGEFADNSSSIDFCELLNIMKLISDEHNYNKALEEINKLLLQRETVGIYESWFNLEKGKALYYLGCYEEALISLDKVVIPNVHHPFDLSLLYVIDTYRALVLHELGNREEALVAAEKAMGNFASLPYTPFKKFSEESFLKIKNGLIGNV